MGCSQSTTASAPASNAAAAPVSSAPTSAGQVSGQGYTISDYSITDKSVVMYHIETRGAVVQKRFTDFKAFHQQVQGVAQVPAMPEAGLLTAFKRRDESLIQIRRTRFQEILNAAPEDDVAAFLAVETSEVVTA
ncbi:Aste57867_11302 [Aphanomyces stellatus]|uniref:Aste57867_11302 protein n=1 Tax=Aphanomyces stellatus TaxID=120398 RepID=A0A485KSK9_9STRA|nr:hypothetical protein As57867_011260 [Aphanomyces stellatus]VFT88164.1 Aste57867_11302 [Aphanomyces stellatus]